MKHYTQLEAWRIGIELVREIHVVTKKFPKEEQFELAKQLRRSSKSILANIAEGFGRYTYKDKAAKYTIARGECTETDAHLRIAIALQLITEVEATKALQLADNEGRLLSGLITASKRYHSQS